MSTKIGQEEFDELKEEVRKAQDAASRAQGQLDELTERLKEEFGCSTVAQAKDKLDEMEKAEQKAQRRLDEAAEAYEKKWKGND